MRGKGPKGEAPAGAWESGYRGETGHVRPPESADLAGGIMTRGFGLAWRWNGASPREPEACHKPVT